MLALILASTALAVGLINLAIMTGLLSKITRLRKTVKSLASNI